MHLQLNNKKISGSEQISYRISKHTLCDKTESESCQNHELEKTNFYNQVIKIPTISHNTRLHYHHARTTFFSSGASS